MIFRWMLIAVFVVNLLGTANSQDLNQTTFISLNETKQPLRDVLTKFEQQGNVTIDVESIIPRKEVFLSKEVTVKFKKKPFWEAMSLLMDVADLRIDNFYRSKVALKRKPVFPFPNEPMPVAEPITTGPFQARLEKHGTFNQLDVVIRPEPWVGTPYVASYEATVNFENGQSITYKPDYLIWVYRLSNEVSLRIEMDDWPKGVAVRKVDVTARLQIGIDWNQITLPPVSQMASREIKANDGVIRIKKAGFEKKTNSKYDEYGVTLRLEGVDLAENEKNLERFFLVSPKGTLINPSKAGVSQGESNNIKWTFIDLGFAPDEVKGNFQNYQLSLLLEDGTKKVIGPIGEISPRVVTAGRSQIAISKSRLFAGQFELLNYGVRIPWDKVRLDVGQEAPLEPQGHSRGSNYPHEMSFDFQTHQIKTRRSQWKLVVEGPTKSVDRTLTLTFDDVEIPEE